MCDLRHARLREGQLCDPAISRPDNTVDLFIVMAYHAVGGAYDKSSSAGRKLFVEGIPRAHLDYMVGRKAGYLRPIQPSWVGREDRIFTVSIQPKHAEE